jgi:hypothetical protein
MIDEQEETSIRHIVRFHMEMPFAAVNGMLSGFTSDNVKIVNKNVDWSVASQSPTMVRDLTTVFGKSALYLPTRYELGDIRTNWKDDLIYDDVACLGSLRVLKNQVIQAIAAIQFARMRGKKLRFHVNEFSDEYYGKNIFSMLQTVFSCTPDAKLVVHPWYPHSMFLHVLSTMTIGLQVSMSESSNVVSLDMASVGLPMVTSPEIKWIANESKAYTTDSGQIASKMLYTINHPELVAANRKAIEEHNKGCLGHWQKVLAATETPNVLFLVQKSTADSGVSAADEQDCQMLNDAGIAAVIEQTDWTKASLFGSIGIHNPTHVIYEAAMDAVSGIRFNSQLTPMAIDRERVVNNEFLDVMAKVRI